jgi:ABC-type spermidine/putrescine transport system permease subunit II
VARLLLVPVALLALLGGLAGVVLAGWAEGGPAAGALADPALVLGWRGAALAAAIVALAAVPAGFAGALALWGAGGAVRLLAAGLGVLLVAAPGVGYGPVSLAHLAADRGALLPLAAAVARAAAVALLLTGVGLRQVPPGLRRAAMLAGARPGQAWRHAVLAPLWPYLLAAAVAAFFVALAEGPEGAVLAAHLALAREWLAPAALLLLVGGLAGLASLLRPRQVGA